MKLISWNVNGLRACLTHGFAESFAALDADIFSVQETKMQPGQADFAPDGYTEYTYSAEKKGYSGTACWCREQPLTVTAGIGIEQHDHEGRVLTLEYPGFWLVNCYTPNSQDGLKRLDYRMEWEDAFRAYLLALDAKKPVILCGDLNVAHREIDIVRAGVQVGKALPDCRILHRRNPETGERLGTSGSLIDQPEDQLALASRVAGVDQFRHIGALHQGTENVELVSLFLGHHIVEGGGQDGKVLIPPLLIAVIVGGRVRQSHQMTNAPGNEPAAAFKIAIGPGCDTQGRCDTLCYTRFFADHQFAQFCSSCSPCSGMSSFSYSSSSNS